MIVTNTAPLALEALAAEPATLAPIHRLTMVGHQGVEASLSYTPDHRRLKLVLDTPHIKDLRNVLLRGLNTWDKPPAWLLELADMVDAQPPAPPAQSIAP